MSIGDVQNYVYAYDDYGRINKISTPAGEFNYTCLDNSDLVSQMTRPNGVTTTWRYEQNRNLITQVQNGTISTFDYTNNAIGNRLSVSRSGSAFSTPDTLSYTYNSRGEVTGATSDKNAAYHYAYNFDPIGNRLTASLAGIGYNYTSNALNQYTAITSGSTTTDLTYDFDGNMLTRDGWTQTWNGENRMVQAVKGNVKLQFTYDYMGRRVEKKVFDGDTLIAHGRFVYSNYKQVEELDALNNNVTVRRYTWQPESVGLDVPLALADVTSNAVYTYTTDANKNVTGLQNTAGTSVVHYDYSPFGTQTVAIESSAQTNPFRFSSEACDPETDLVYYNYRYYDSRLGRWIKRDPIAEKGGLNLYGMLNNTLLTHIDTLGLKCCGDHELQSGEGCCNGKIYKTSTQGCCNSKDIYLLATHCCCNDTTVYSIEVIEKDFEDIKNKIKTEMESGRYGWGWDYFLKWRQCYDQAIDVRVAVPGSLFWTSSEVKVRWLGLGQHYFLNYTFKCKKGNCPHTGSVFKVDPLFGKNDFR